MVVASVDTYVAQSETCPEALPLDSSRHAHSDKFVFTYHLALENVIDDVICSNDVDSTAVKFRHSNFLMFYTMFQHCETVGMSSKMSQHRANDKQTNQGKSKRRKRK